jgi:hypothetical protein|nr:hypothetical protein [uncultured Acetatifactor sp.]
MILFTRKIGRIELHIQIDEDLYNANLSIFNCIFSTFRKNKAYISDESSMRDSIYIFSTDVTLRNLENESYFIQCNTCDPLWVTELIGILEEWYATTMKCTILHGSCIRLLDKNILLMGARKFGKTTLTGYLALNRNAEYLDDDCVYFFEDEIWGFNMPIAVRKNVDKLPLNNLVCTAYDGENIERMLFRPFDCIDKLSSIEFILFPVYNTENINRAIEIKKGVLFNKIINNVRHSQSISKLFHDVCELSKDIKAFSIWYSTSENAYRIINSIICKEWISEAFC